MSWQAMEAVQDYSRFQSQKDYAAFRILLALASYADENGIAGVPGDYRACPSYRAIAEKAHLHRNTVGKVMPVVLASGEVEIVEQGGVGRALWSVYRICLPMDGRMAEAADVPIEEEMAHGSREGVDTWMMEMAHELAHGMAHMKEELAHLRAELAHGIGNNGTRLQREPVPDPLRDPGDPDRDPGDPGARDGAYRVLHEDSPPFPADPVGLGEGGTESRQDAVHRSGGRAPKRDLVRPALDGMGRRRAEAIAAVCGLDMRVRSHRKRCEEAAVQLTGYPEAYIVARYGPPNGEDGGGVEGWNWYVHDWRGRKGEQPEPRLVVETIGKVWVGDGGTLQGRQDAAGGAPTVMSNNETTARKYAELRRKMMED